LQVWGKSRNERRTLHQVSECTKKEKEGRNSDSEARWNEEKGEKGK